MADRERKDRIRRALESVRTDGRTVRDWSFYISETRRFNLGIKDRQIANAHAPLSMSETCGASYRLIWDDGLVSRGSLERRQIETDLVRALADARATAYDDPDAAWVMGPAPIPDVLMHDPETAAMAAGRIERLAGRLAHLRGRLDTDTVRTWSGSLSAGEGFGWLMTSQGVDLSGKGTSTGWHVSVNGETGDGYSSRLPEDDDKFESRLERLLERAAELDRPAEPMDGGIHPVILHPGVVEEYVIGTLLSNLGGATVAHGEGHFRRDQFGSDEPVLRDDLTLRVDPLQPLKLGAYRYTTEGVPAAKCSYIENGRLIQPLVDLKYSRRLGLPPTPLPYSMDTLVFEGNDAMPVAEALETADGGALVLSVLGVHTQDSASGDFSLSAPQVLRIGSGGYAGRLRATISGNLFELLAGSSLRFVDFHGETTPGLLVHTRLDP